MSDNTEVTEQEKPMITGKFLMHFVIAAVAMSLYYYTINEALMKVQGLQFRYLWVSGSGGGESGH